MDAISSDHEESLRIHSLKVAELRRELERYGLSSRGKKELLAKKLIDHRICPEVTGTTDSGTVILNRHGAALGRLMRHPDAVDFNQSVRVLWPANWFQYCSVVETPMDLGTVKKSLTQNRYRGDPAQLVTDTRLVFENCIKFNSNPSNGFYIKAQALLACCDELFGPVPAPAEASAASPLSIVVATKRKGAAEAAAQKVARVTNVGSTLTVAAAAAAAESGSAAADGLSDSDDDSDDDGLFVHPWKTKDDLAAETKARQAAVQAKRESAGNVSFEEEFKRFKSGDTKPKAEAGAAAAGGANAAADVGGTDIETAIDLTCERAKICKAL